MSLSECFSKISFDGMKIKDVNPESFTNKEYEELCIAAVKQNGLALEHVRIQTREISDLALRQNSNSQKYSAFVSNPTYDISKHYSVYKSM